MSSEHLTKDSKPEKTQHQDEVPPSSPHDDPYPEQRHAGKVGYGPMYHQGPVGT